MSSMLGRSWSAEPTMETFETLLSAIIGAPELTLLSFKWYMPPASRTTPPPASEHWRSAAAITLAHLPGVHASGVRDWHFAQREPLPPAHTTSRDPDTNAAVSNAAAAQTISQRGSRVGVRSHALGR